MPAVPLLQAPSGFQNLLHRLRVRARRLRNEGFGWFLASVLLFAISLVLLRTYYIRETALEHAIQEELIATVGTQQEPSENSSELGLIAAALAPINRGHALASGVVPEAGCGPGDQICPAVAALESNFAREVYATLNSGASPGEVVLRYPVLNVGRPELGPSSSCANADPFDPDATSVIVPAQLRDDPSGPLPPRLARAVAFSSALEHSIKDARARFGKEEGFSQLVQAYFISPDSVLRIWSSRKSNVCASFDQFRLWASKSYVTYFWSHPEKSSYSTEAYIDYGGYGLVQTRCVGIEEPRLQDSGFDHGRLFGVLCSDIRLSQTQLDRLRRQLFFETALVTFSPTTDLPFVKADTTLPEPQIRAGSPQAPEVALAAIGGGGASSQLTSLMMTEVSRRFNQVDTERAIGMQAVNVKTAAIEAAVGERIRGTDLSALGRRPTRLSFADHDAFLLPVGDAPAAECGNHPDLPCQRAIFFYPRNPTLPDRVKWSGAVGYALFGMSLVAGGVGIRHRPRSEQLRERLALLRNLQVGVIRADPDNVIVEANDRAEEILGRRLPKDASDRRGLWSKVSAWAAERLLHRVPRRSLSIRFFDLIDVCLQERQGRKESETRSKRLEEGEIGALRKSGRSSRYYARLRPRRADAPVAASCWLEVAATPMMHVRHDRLKGAQLSHVFASIREVDPHVAAELDADLRAIDQQP